MQLELEFSSIIEKQFSEIFFHDVFYDTLLENGRYDFTKAHVFISTTIVSEDVIKKINCTYRNRDAVTDVISFSFFDADLYSTDNKSVLNTCHLGELLICYEYVKKSAIINEVSVGQEMAYVASHGLLHLLGFIHGAPMFLIQDSVSHKYKDLQL